MDIIYLSTDDVIEIHAALTGISGGPVRREVLKSAVALPQATMFGEDLYPEFYTKAAALLRSLAMNHPFIDGNKRVAWGAMRAFLLVNGIDIRASVPEVEAFMLSIVTNTLSPDDAALFIARHAYDLVDKTAASTASDEQNRSEL